MTDFAELLLREQNNVNATVLEFINSEYKSDDIIVFVEGVDDPPFYFDFLTTEYPNRTMRIYTCGGKKALSEVKDFLNDYGLKIKPLKMFYLRDRDFDEFNNRLPDDMFVTKYYSIESYFADGAYVKYLINKFIPTLIREKSRDAIVSSVDDLMQKMTARLIVPMAVFCYLRREEVDVDFQKISIGDFFKYNAQVGNIIPERNRMRKIVPLIKMDDYILDKKEIRAICREFKDKNYKYWIKGKIALQMLRLSLKQVAVQIGGPKQNSLESLSSKIGSFCFSQSRQHLNRLPELSDYFERA
jgi:hypothetical protein